MAAIIDLQPLPTGNPTSLVPLAPPAVTPLYTDPARARHECASVEYFGRRLATLLGRPFRDQALPGLPGYFIPLDTLTCEEAAMRGITCAQDLFGGVVPHAFVASKLVSHGLVANGAGAPPGWAPQLGAALGDAVLPGYSVFSADDARRALAALLPLGRVRGKLAHARGGHGQRVMASQADLDAWLTQVSDAEIADGVVIELNLESALTFSIGCVEVGGASIAYFGTQRTIGTPSGEVVYGGSVLRVARGGLDQLRHVPLPRHAGDAIARVQHYESTIAQAYPGFFASRRNYDVVHGRDAKGIERCGVLEQSWRFGGASPAEILALEVLCAAPGVPWLDAMTYETYEDEPVPGDALVYFQGQVASLGRLTKYARVTVDGCDP
jgi:hypothetical protein